jgi:hypothetical protein
VETLLHAFVPHKFVDHAPVGDSRFSERQAGE